MRKPGGKFAATACSVMARRDHKLAASMNNCAELKQISRYLEQLQARNSILVCYWSALFNEESCFFFFLISCDTVFFFNHDL